MQRSGGQGTIPKGWRLVCLGDVANVQGGVGFPLDRQGRQSGDYPFIKVSDMNLDGNESYIRNANNYVDQRDAAELGASIFSPGTIVFPKVGAAIATNKKRALTIPTIIDNNMVGITVSNEQRCNARFLHNWFESIDIAQFANVSTVPSITTTRLKREFILLPPLPEQRAIAAVLDTIDDSIERTEAVIEATEQLRDSLLHELLTRGVPGWHTAWKEVPGLGTMPADWDVVSLGGVAEVKGGKRLPKGSSYADRNTGLPYIRVVDFHDRTVDTDAIQYLSPEIHKVISNYTISSKDVYISIAGTIGLVGTVPTRFDGANLTENAAKIAIHDCEQLSQTFLVAFLDSSAGQSQIAIRVTMLGQPKLALERIKTIELPLPPLPEQQAIAATLDGVDATLEKMYRERDGLGLLKESTADALLTGRVRVGKLGKLMNEQDSMSDLSEATLWDARQVTARGFESIAALNQPLFPPGLTRSIAALNQPLFPPGLMKSIAALNLRAVFPPGLTRSIAALNQPLFPPGLTRSIAALNQPPLGCYSPP